MDPIQQTEDRLAELQRLLIDHETEKGSLISESEFEYKKEQLMNLYGLNVALLQHLNGGSTDEAN